MRELLPFSEILKPSLEEAGYPVLLTEIDDCEDKIDVLFIQFKDHTIPSGIYINVTLEQTSEQYCTSLYERGHSGGDIEISENLIFEQSEIESKVETLLGIVANNTLLRARH